jgi:hypothetical protein
MKKVFTIQPPYGPEIFELEKLLNSGWTIERCDAHHVATGSIDILYGALVYILKNDSL